MHTYVYNACSVHIHHLLYLQTLLVDHFVEIKLYMIINWL